MTTNIELSEDAFAALFKPIRNHLNPNASFDWGAGFGTLFETYGEEFDFFQQQGPARVWTLLSGDTGDFIGSGLHFVNRIGYFLTKREVEIDLNVEVRLDEVECHSPVIAHEQIAMHLQRVIDYLRPHVEELGATMQGVELCDSIQILLEWSTGDAPYLDHQ